MERVEVGEMAEHVGQDDRFMEIGGLHQGLHHTLHMYRCIHYPLPTLSLACLPYTSMNPLTQ